MAAPKRSKAQREHDLAEMADLLLRGLSQRDLAHHFDLSPGTISYDVKEVERRWRDRAVDAIETWKGRLLAGHERVIREAWREWGRSQSDAERIVETTELVKPGTTTKTAAEEADDGIKADEPVQVLEVTRRVLTTEGQTGDPRYLTVIEGALTEQARLLGANAPERKEHTGADGAPLAVQVIEVVAPIDEGAP